MYLLVLSDFPIPLKAIIPKRVNHLAQYEILRLLFI